MGAIWQKGAKSPSFLSSSSPWPEITVFARQHLRRSEVILGLISSLYAEPKYKNHVDWHHQLLQQGRKANTEDKRLENIISPRKCLINVIPLAETGIDQTRDGDNRTTWLALSLPNRFGASLRLSKLVPD